MTQTLILQISVRLCDLSKITASEESQQESHGIQNWSNGREFSKGVLIQVWAGLRNINKDCWSISRLIMELWVLKEQGEGYPELTATVAFGGCSEVVGDRYSFSSLLNILFLLFIGWPQMKARRQGCLLSSIWFSFTGHMEKWRRMENGYGGAKKNSRPDPQIISVIAESKVKASLLQNLL